MLKEDLGELGFKHEVIVDFAAVDKSKESNKEKKGFYGGLSVKPINK